MKVLSLLNPFFLATKFAIKTEANKRQNNATFITIKKMEFVQDKSCHRNSKKKNSIKIPTNKKFNGVDFLKTLVIIRIFYTFVIVNIILV